MITTYSIVAFDADAREWGVAVQSKFLGVGAAVPYAQAEAGAVATQALANVAYGPDGIERMANGVSAAETVTQLVEADPDRDHRQVGVVDRSGASASHTGSECLEWAGSRMGRHYAAQGNLLRSADTVDALAETFERLVGCAPLAERLVECLSEAQLAGGDRRGQQSAALLIVRTGGGYGGRNDRAVDLRVDDHASPIGELKRLLAAHRRLFGSTPEVDWVQVSPALAQEMRERLDSLGYADASLEKAFSAWAGVENLEERVQGIARVDPVVLSVLREARYDRSSAGPIAP